MTNRKLLFCCLLSSCFTLILYKLIFPTSIIVNHDVAAKQVKNDLLLSDKLDKIFNSSSPSNFITAAHKCKEAVVFINSIEEEKYVGSFTKQLNTSNGSGVIISQDGYIVTNHHVIENSDAVEVMLNDNREYKAEVIGMDQGTDLALLKIEADNLPYLIFGNSDSLYVGEWVLAIGNPFRLQSTVTAGIISAKARNINMLSSQQGIESYIQTDAVVNSGNSGGALINTRGDLVGISSAIISYTGKYEGYSFAIPSNLAKKVIFDIKEFGAVQRGWMGVSIANVDDQKAKSFNLKEVSGVLLEIVNKDGAAKEAGLQRNDIIISVNEIKINTVPQFMEQVGRYRPGDKINIEYLRNGHKEHTIITLRNQLNTTDFVAIRKDKILTKLGFELRDLDSNESKRLGNTGVYVVSIYKNSTIDNTNMEPGYVISELNGEQVTSVNHFIALLKSKKGNIRVEGVYEKYPGFYPYSFFNP